jgi:hypothetical protein
MADKIGARKDSIFKAVCTAPDFCKTPVGSSTPPLPYQIISNLENSVSIVPNVKFNGRPCYVLNQSVVPTCTGDEPGVAKGVRSGTVRGETKPTGASSTVKAGKKRVVRERDTCTMNNGNTNGIYVTQPAPGFRKGLTDAAKKIWEDVKGDASTLWDATGMSEADHEAASAARGRIWDGAKGMASLGKDTMLIQFAPGTPMGQEAMGRLGNMGKAVWNDIAQTYKQSYAEGGLSQAAGTGTWAVVNIAIQVVLTKGAGEAVAALKGAKTMEGAANALKLASKEAKALNMAEKEVLALERAAAIAEEKAVAKDGVKIKKRLMKLREKYLGKTPGKKSKTGREVIERMRKEGKIRERFGKTEFQASDGRWYSIDKADMAHKTDAVTWWNETGRQYGAKSKEVRDWMLDSKNYTLDHRTLNRSAGAKLGQTYLPPLK